VGGEVLELPAAARDELAALVGGPLEGAGHRLVGGPVDERADQRAVRHRVADGQAAVRRDQPVGELVDHAAVRDDPAHRRAALARGAGRGEHDPARGQVEVRAPAHDGGVVPPELEQGATEPVRDAWSDGPAHARRAGRAEQGDARVLHQRRAQIRPADEHLAEVGGRATVGEGPGQDRVARQRRQGRQLRRLPDDGVAADQGDGRVPRPHRRGEVEGADDPDHAERVPGLHQSVARALGGHRAPVQLSGQADREVADVDHLLDLTARLGGDLADLEADQGRQVLLVHRQELTEALDQGTASGRGDRTPLQERGLGAGDALVDGGARHPADGGQRLAVDRRGGDRVAGHGAQVDPAATGGGQGELLQLRAAGDLSHGVGHEFS
jgi:hypothetical protein